MTRDTAKNAALLLFARRPELGSGKRRLAAQLGDDAAHAINSAMYAAALADLSAWPGPAIAALAGSQQQLDDAFIGDTENNTKSCAGPITIQQPEGSFGSRLKDIDTAVRETHDGPVLFIGSDAPELTEQFYSAAARLLLDHDIVLAPASDGGVTLLGAKTTWPDLEQLPWGSNQLCDALEASARAAGLSVVRMPSTADVDTVDDLLRLRQSLSHDARPTRRLLAQEIQRLLPDIAVVIPVKGDHQAALELGSAMRRQGVEQVVITCAENSPQLRSACCERGIDYQQHDRNRGQRLDIAARSVNAGILWFLHADATPELTAVAAIRRHLITHDGGCFRFQFSEASPPAARGLAMLINWRARHFMPYGDQGIFLRRDAYLASGGFAHEPLFEEVSVIKYLRKQCRFALLETPIGVSNRRWVKDGWLRRTLMNRYLVLRYVLGTAPEKLARRYQRR